MNYQKLIGAADHELLKYVILHELVHLKLGHPYHNREFFVEIDRHIVKNVNWYDKKLRKVLRVGRMSLI